MGKKPPHHSQQVQQWWTSLYLISETVVAFVTLKISVVTFVRFLKHLGTKTAECSGDLK